MDVTLINLGHLPPVYKPYGEPSQLLEFSGDILGVHDDPVFGVMTLKVKEKDRFILYTDGLLESQNDSTIWTQKIDSLPLSLDTIKNTEILELSEALYNEVRAENNPPDDDILIMSIEI
jgi:sigma-B regulation protein RsbU (phosphoserine phosphatase)